MTDLRGPSAQGANTPFARDRGPGKSTGQGSGRDGAPMVPKAEPTSYYGRPVIKEPVWTWEIPWYFVIGGTAGVSGALAVGALLSGNETLATRASLVGLAGAGISPALLIMDLGRPSRFFNMLRVFKVTSPMSHGTWTLVFYSGAVAHAALARLAPSLPGSVGRLARAASPAPLSAASALGSAVFGPLLATYTAALFSNTAVPAWHDARHSMPFVFAASASAAAGGMNAIVTPVADAGPARALAVGGAVAELVAVQVMERGLNEHVRPAYHDPVVRRYARAAIAATVTGATVLAVGGRRSRLAAVLGGATLWSGSALERWAIFKAGKVSARDPQATLGPQRDRVRRGAPATGTAAVSGDRS